MTRAKRKAEHLKYALMTGSTEESRFEDITFVHNSLPKTKLSTVNLHHHVGELLFSSPIFINAMTGGGGKATYNINKQLGLVAKETGVAIAVGSQMSALRDINERKTFTVIREQNEDGVIFSNLGMDATVDEAKAAIEMIDANALQIHLNTVQELTMPEGDRDFSDVVTKIEKIVNQVEVPVIVKEVGFGMSRETVNQLTSVGVKIIDIGGYGGTNFSKIENKRREDPLNFFDNWGISTTSSLIEAVTVKGNATIFASGGVQTAQDIAKSIALGADAVGMAGYLLSTLVNEGVSQLIKRINDLNEQLKMIMTALGAKTIPELQAVPLVISGQTHHWLTERRIDTTLFSNR